ncbi:MAG: hypothetical protein QG652_1284 [Pseudomonadota bacterium]|nr:hypothetical protein [Pseudomonadota bacterium]
MHPKKQSVWWPVMAISLIASLAFAASLWLLYQATHQNHLRDLKQNTETLANIIESVARTQTEYNPGLSAKDIFQITLNVLEQGLVLTRFDRGDEELLIGMREGHVIRILRKDDEGLGFIANVPFDGKLSQPLYHALHGKTGSGELIDYAGNRVMAGYAPVPTLGIGIVMKIPREHIQAPYIRAAVWSAGIVLVMIGLFSTAFIQYNRRYVNDLTASEQRFAAIVEHIPFMISLKRAGDLRIALLNRAGEKLLGLDRTQLIGKSDYDRFPGEQAARLTAKDRHVLNVSGYENITEEWIDTLSSGRRLLHTQKIALKNARGKATYLLGISEDITERRQAEQALIDARDEADRASRAKSDFLSNMSHELRTPMNAILGFSQLLEYDPALTERQKGNVQEIGKAGQHLLKIINEVLDLARIESGRIDLSLEPVDVSMMVEECLSLVRALAEKRHIKTACHKPAGLSVRADHTRLRQALLNLLSNAIKYNREAGQVEVNVVREGSNRLRIRVTDTGPGIEARHLAELFQPFNRLNAARTGIEGTGIGLTISRRLIEMMGGTVGVESEVGTGSTFWIELPLETASETAPGQDHPETATGNLTPLLAATTTETPTRTVLYIEDNPANLKLVAQILTQHPHIHLLTAHTPWLGIELAQTRHPHLILLDINLPGMDGYQVLEIFRSDAQLKKIPVVAITANAMPRDIERGKQAGFTDYLTKPLDIVHFRTVIDRLLGESESGNKTSG